MRLHPDIRIRQLSMGNEKAPLIVVDNFVADPDELVKTAAASAFRPGGPYYPGIRVEAPPAYQMFFVEWLKDVVLDLFQMRFGELRLTMCHYSLVTTPAAKLHILQRIPHVDSMEPNGLASIHYLFRQNLGGTGFYRHRKTGFESIDPSRRDVYYRSLESENDGPNMPAPAYINGDTPLFEQIAKQDGVFNRALIYRRNSLHSGCIDRAFVPDPNPLTGRLSINSFIDVLP